MAKDYIKALQNWRSTEFKSSSGKTEEFKSFVRTVRSYLKQEVDKSNLQLVKFNVGHFYISGFFWNKLNGRYVYFNIGDVRWHLGSHWADSVLYRIANNDRDFTGGSNRYTKIENLVQDAEAWSM